MSGSELSVPPAHVTAAAMYHLGGAMHQLKSFSAEGPTVYALTVFGAKHGAATLAGPALDVDGLAAGWPAEAREAAAAVFSRPAFRRAGDVVVIAVVQAGRVTHCVVVNVPGDARQQHPREAAPREAAAYAGGGPFCAPAARRAVRAAARQGYRRPRRHGRRPQEEGP